MGDPPFSYRSNSKKVGKRENKNCSGRGQGDDAECQEVTDFRLMFLSGCFPRLALFQKEKPHSEKLVVHSYCRKQTWGKKCTILHGKVNNMTV